MGLKAKDCWSCSPGSEKWQTFLVSCWLTHESQTVIQRENVKWLLDEQILKIKRLRKNLKNSLSYRLSKKTYLILITDVFCIYEFSHWLKWRRNTKVDAHGTFAVTGRHAGRVSRSTHSRLRPLSPLRAQCIGNLGMETEGRFLLEPPHLGSVAWKLIPALAWVSGAALGDLTSLNLVFFFVKQRK